MKDAKMLVQTSLTLRGIVDRDYDPELAAGLKQIAKFTIDQRKYVEFCGKEGGAYWIVRLNK